MGERATDAAITLLGTYNRHNSSVRETKENKDACNVALQTTLAFKEMKEKAQKKEPSLKTVPRFFFKKPAAEDRIQVLLRKEARSRFMKYRQEKLLDNQDLDLLWQTLEENETPPEDIGSKEKFVDYDAFTTVKNTLPDKFHPFFSSRIFLQFERDELGRIPISEFFQYVMRQVSLTQIRIGFCFYDATGYGYLREEDLENYIFELIPSLPQLSSLVKEFYPFYVCTAVRKFFFFLDPHRKGKVTIKDLLVSPILAELFELREEEVMDADMKSNWFSARSAQRVYGQYLNLDFDRNGMLSRNELLRYGDGTLTRAFVDRIFQECHTYDGEMDYKSFLDFVLAMENKRTPQAMAYFFRLLDVQRVGYLNSFALNYFFREVLVKMKNAGHDPVNFEDVRDEIFDMIKPQHPLHITYEDIVKSGCSETIINILTDMKGFWLYDNRESLVQDPDQ